MYVNFDKRILKKSRKPKMLQLKQKNKLELLPKKKKKRSMTTEHLKNGLMILSL